MPTPVRRDFRSLTPSGPGWCLLLVAALAVLTVSPASAQTGTGSIQGVVTDGSGAALPGVTITAKSPALQVPELVIMSGADGSYQFRALPLGLYELSYELVGFQSVVRAGQRLSAGFVATINVEMKIGGVEETLTVVGESPVIDVRTTTAQSTVSQEMIENLPVAAHWIQTMSLAAGVRVNTPDVAGSTMAGAPNYSAYGAAGQNSPMIEGLNTREGADAAGFHYDSGSMAEAQVKALGAGADVGTPGVNFVGIVKSGGNEFHGRYAFAGHHEDFFLKLQSDNLTDELRARGVSAGTKMRWFRDISGDLGGRIVRDKLWFYGSVRRQEARTVVIGYVKDAGPDGVLGTSDDTPGNPGRGEPADTLKLTYQPASHSKIIGFVQKNKGQIFERDSSRFSLFESTYDYYFAPTAAKGEYQATPRSNLLVSMIGGYVWYWTNFQEQEGMNRPGNPSRTDLFTGMNAGPPVRIYRSFRRHWQTAGNATYYADATRLGAHAIKAGYDLHWEHRAPGIEPSRPSGDYQLVFDNGAPLRIVTADLPVTSKGSKMDNFAAYIQDAWSIGQNLTVTLGLRAERYHNYVDPAVKEQGVFGGAGEFPGVDVLTWNSFVPRLGFAWNVTSDAKTVLKGTWGLFGWNPSVDFSNNWNRNTRTTTTYRWRDLNGNRDYDPGEVNLATTGTAPDFISTSGAATTLLNPDLEQPTTSEASLSVEREVMANVGVTVRFVNKSVRNEISTVNTLRPYSAYDLAFPMRDPGPDGVAGTADDGDMVTVYDYNAAYRGAAFVGNQPQNAPDARSDRYRTIEVTMMKRRTRNFDLLASVAATKNRDYINNIVTNPNQERFPIDETWAWDFKIASSISAPYGIQLAAFVVGLSGTPQQRTNVFRNLPQSSTLTLPLEELGTQKIPNLYNTNIRLGKQFRLGGKMRLEVTADLYNALNVSTVRGQSFQSGPNYGVISSIFPPRIMRLGTVLTF